MKRIHNIADVSTENRREVILSHIFRSLETDYSWKFLENYQHNIITNTRRVHLVVDYDVDGLTAGAILYQYLDDRGVDISVRTFTRTEGFSIKPEDLRKDRLNVVLDRGSPEISSGVYEGYDVLVIDHHGFSGSPKGNVVLVNPRTEDVTKYPCTSLIVHRLFGTQANIPLVLLGLLGDVCELDRETHDRFYQSWVTKTPWGKFSSPQDVRFGIIPKLNACGRVGKTEVALRYLVKPSRGLWRSINRLNRLRKEECEKIRPLKVLRLESVTFALYPREAAGHISYLAQHLTKGNKLGIAAYFDEPSAGYRLSMRCNKPILTQIYNQSQFHIGGHAHAGGGYVGFQQIRDFLTMANEICKQQINSLQEEYPMLNPEDLEDEELISALESVSLNPPVTFRGSEAWFTIPNVANQLRKRPTYHLKTLHWGFPHGERILTVNSFHRKINLRWLY